MMKRGHDVESAPGICDGGQPWSTLCRNRVLLVARKQLLGRLLDVELSIRAPRARARHGVLVVGEEISAGKRSTA
jgi:hypothetical protein